VTTMQLKIFEVRDEATFIAAFAFSTDNPAPGQAQLLAREGYRDRQIMFGYLSGERPASPDYYFWDCRTMATAHKYVFENWDRLRDGDVIDVQFILGETKEAKRSEAGA